MEAVCSDCDGGIVKKKEALIWNLCIAYGVCSDQHSSKFLSGFSTCKHIHQPIDIHGSSQKYRAHVEAYLLFSSGKTILDLTPVKRSHTPNWSCKEGK